MKFRIEESGRLPTDALYDGVYEYFTVMKRRAGDSLKNVRFKADISYTTSREIWCRPCDVKKLYEGKDNGSAIISYEKKGKELIVNYNHKSTEDIVSDVPSSNSGVVCVLTSSDYVLNLAMGYFRVMNRPASADAWTYQWLREYTIEDAKFKRWPNRDITASFSDMAELTDKIGVRDDTYLCLVTNGQVIEAGHEGVRKARQRKKRAFSM